MISLASTRPHVTPDLDRLRQEFLSLYPSRTKHIYKAPGDPKWKTRQIPLFTGMIDAAISAECDTFYGAFFGKQTGFAVLDIDEGSQYHNAAELEKIVSAVESVGLAVNLYQSSRSEGWHLYLSFVEAAQSEEVGETLKRWLRALGYEIKGGVLEIFPSGNALRLPLQPGFAWLDSEGHIVRRRAELELEEALAFFLEDLEENACDWEVAKSQIESQILLADRARDRAAGNAGDGHEERLEMSGFDHVFSQGCIKVLWESGRRFWQEGLQKPGDRHNAVLAVGHYLWYGDEEGGVQALPGGRYDKYRAALIEQWLEQKHNGMCRHINEGNWRIVKEQIQRAVDWRKKKEEVREPYPLTPRLLKRLVGIYKKTGRIWAIEQFERANENSKVEARERIAEAIRQLKKEKPGSYISTTEIAERAKAHWKTVKKNLDLLVLVQSLEEKSLETETNFDLLAAPALVSNPGGRASGCSLGEGTNLINTESSPKLLDFYEPNSPVPNASESLALLFVPKLLSSECPPEISELSDPCLDTVFVGKETNIASEGANTVSVNELEISKQGILLQFPVCTDRISDRKTPALQEAPPTHPKGYARLHPGAPSVPDTISNQLRSSPSLRCFADLTSRHLKLVGSSKQSCSCELAPIYLTPPFLSCLAHKPTTCTQHHDQALRVPAEVLTPGPMLRGFQAVLQESAGGLELSYNQRQAAFRTKHKRARCYHQRAPPTPHMVTAIDS